MAEILSKMFGKKRRNIGDLIYGHDLANLPFGATLYFIKINYAIIACMTYAFT